MRRLLIALTLLCACAALAGCGNKGPLVRPSAKTATIPAAAGTAPAPATTA